MAKKFRPKKRKRKRKKWFPTAGQGERLAEQGGRKSDGKQASERVNCRKQGESGRYG